MLLSVATLASLCSALFLVRPLTEIHHGVKWIDPLEVFSAPSGAKLVYNGGPVISAVEVFTIFWGGSDVVKFSSQLEQFYGAVTDSPWFKILAQYKTPTQSINAGKWTGSFSYASAALGSIQDSDIQTALLALIAAKSIPTPNSNTYYAIHFAPGVSISMQGSNSCSAGGFCAYHSSINKADGTVLATYGVLPDVTQGGCSSGCGTDASPFNNLCSVSSHELAEMVTDPAVGAATSIGFPLAWYDATNGEIGDICNAQQGTTIGRDGKKYTIQTQFSNKQKDCVSK